MISVILEGRAQDDPSLTENQIQLLNSLNSVKFQMGSEQWMMCANSIPNMGYSSFSHTISFCPTYARYPENTMFLQLAHELGHVVDPCFVRQGLYKLKENLSPENVKNNENSLNGKPQFPDSKPNLASDNTIHSRLMECVQNHIKSKLDQGFDIWQY